MAAGLRGLNALIRRSIMQASSRRSYAAAVGLTALAACASVTMIVPASAQFWGSWDRRPQQQPQRPQQQQQQPQQYNPFGGFWGPSDNKQREAPADYSRAPGPQKKPDPAATTTVVVVGDAMADWLAY